MIEEEELEPVSVGPTEGKTMTLREHEARWGFTLDELKAATRVVRTLFLNPSLFVGDTYLYESRLYTMITRDRKTKRENREVYKAIMSEEKSQRKRFKRMQDIEAIRRTEMKREREGALNALLLDRQPALEESEGLPLLSESADAFSRNDDGTIKDGEEEKEMDGANRLSALDRQIIGLIGAFESVIRLEEMYYAGLATVDWLAASQLVAQLYRYMPHDFGSQMPPALLHGAPPAGASPEEREHYTAVVKLRIARRCVELISLEEGDGEKTKGIDTSEERGNDIQAPNKSALEDVFVPDSAPLRSVSDLRRYGALGSLSDTMRLLPHAMMSADVLCTLEHVLADGVVDVRFNPQDADTASVIGMWSANLSLNLFIARRLYANKRLFDFGESPFTVRTRPPLAEDEEPDSYCVFNEVQLYKAGQPLPRDEVLQLNRWIGCHICRVRYNKLHPYYYSLCHLCGEYNFNKRLVTRDLRGKVVLITGCRIKIGFAMALSLLRCGAELVGTTRFVHEALARFQNEADYAAWKDRLHLFSLDLRDMWMVTQFCAFVIQRFPKLFAIINNAAQTIARTRDYTAQVRSIEAHPPHDLRSCLYNDARGKEWHQFFLANSSVTVGEPLHIEYHPQVQPFLDDDNNKSNNICNDSGGGGVACHEEKGKRAEQSALIVGVSNNDTHHLTFDRYDAAAEDGDRRETNSWMMRLEHVQGSEAAEVMAINALSPFIINSKLKPCLINREGDVVPNEMRFIINVSAMEGQFYRFKQVTHPHTNMAKAALNMMTRTSGEDYAQDGIYMNSVDTGWITDESPKLKRERRVEQLLLCPLDEVDAAARCLDLIYTNSRVYGKFFKDFKEILW